MTSELSYAIWSLLALGAAGLWLRSRQAGSSPARPAAALRRLACGPVLRVVLVATWAFAGWHLFAR